MQYIIAPIGEERDGFNINPSGLANQIQAKWPDTEITEEEGQSIISWTILMDEYPLIGEFLRDKKMVVLDGGQEYVARFAVWYRNILSENQRLWIFDDLGNSEPYEVRLNTTKEEIVQALA